MKKDLKKAMKPLNKQKKIYPAFQDGKKLLCSLCFSKLGTIEKYGHDDTGYWFIACCEQCGGKMRWYRTNSGKTIVEEKEKEDGTFDLIMIDGELTMKCQED
ncbi:MAG: hypothetical protein RSF13_02770 [Clostridiales bacterium]